MVFKNIWIERLSKDNNNTDLLKQLAQEADTHTLNMTYFEKYTRGEHKEANLDYALRRTYAFTDADTGKTIGALAVFQSRTAPYANASQAEEQIGNFPTLTGWYIGSAWVHPDYRGKGVFTLINELALHHLAEEIKDGELLVLRATGKRPHDEGEEGVNSEAEITNLGDKTHWGTPRDESLPIQKYAETHGFQRLEDAFAPSHLGPIFVAKKEDIIFKHGFTHLRDEDLSPKAVSPGSRPKKDYQKHLYEVHLK